jgi:hypothetical protein
LKFLFTYLFFIATNLVLAKDVTITTQVSKNTILIGDTFTYTIKVDFNTAKYNLLLPTLNQQDLSVISIINKTANKVSTNATHTTLQVAYTLSAYDTGMYKIPALPILGNTIDTQSFATEEQFILIENVPVNINGNIKNIHTDINDNTKLKNKIKLVVMLLFFLILILIIAYIFINQYKLKSYYKSYFMQSILQLQSRQHSQNVIDIYSTINHQIKKYIHLRYKVHVLQQSTATTLQRIQEHPLLGKFNVNNLLQTADSVKFAKLNIDTSTAQQDVQTAINTIQEWEKLLVNQELQQAKAARQNKK